MNGIAKRYALSAGLALAACGVMMTMEPWPQSGHDDPRLVNFRGWLGRYEAARGSTDFALALHYLPGVSDVPSQAHGRLEVDLERGEVRVAVHELPAPSAAASFRVLLVRNGAATGNTVALERGPAGDDVLDLGTLAIADGEGTLLRPVDRRALRVFDIDLALVVRDTPTVRDQVVIGGIASLMQKLARRGAERERRERSALASAAWPLRAWRRAAVPAAFADATSPESRALLAMAGEGARLFFQETFGGNGRTCGTCHPAENQFTLTPAFVAGRPADDPLFVAETQCALAKLEHRDLMRGPRALILENIDGFREPPVFRATPHIFNAAHTAPYGLSGEIPTLADFSLGAVVQHFPLTLRRRRGADFRLPTTPELDAMQAFQQTAFSPADQVFDVNQFVGTPQEVAGRDLFGTKKCSHCHDGLVLADASPGLGGGNRNFDTGVVNLPINTTPPLECDPPCEPIGPREGEREFNTPTLFGIANTGPFFHDNSAATLRDAVAFYDSVQFNNSPGAATVGGIALLPAEIDAITAFLQALTSCGNGVQDHGEECDPSDSASNGPCRSNCTLEACGDGVREAGEACDDGNLTDLDGCDSDCSVTCDDGFVAGGASCTLRAISGQRMLLVDRDGNARPRKLSVSSFDPAITSGTPGGTEDPTIVGAVLDVFNSTTGETARIALPAENWIALGGAEGYRYRGDKPCRSVLLRHGSRLHVSCAGPGLAFRLDEVVQGSLTVRLTTGTLRHCMTFGGDVLRDRGAEPCSRARGRFEATQAPAPSACAALP